MKYHSLHAFVVTQAPWQALFQVKSLMGPLQHGHCNGVNVQWCAGRVTDDIIRSGNGSAL